VFAGQKCGEAYGEQQRLKTNPRVALAHQPNVDEKVTIITRKHQSKERAIGEQCKGKRKINKKNKINRGKAKKFPEVQEGREKMAVGSTRWWEENEPKAYRMEPYVRPVLTKGLVREKNTSGLSSNPCGE